MNHYKILFDHPYLFTGLQDIDNLRNYAYISILSGKINLISPVAFSQTRIDYLPLKKTLKSVKMHKETVHWHQSYWHPRQAFSIHEQQPVGSSVSSSYNTLQVILHRRLILLSLSEAREEFSNEMAKLTKDGLASEQRHGRLGTPFWTQVKLLISSVFYLFMRSLLAFGISIHGRYYVCTYIENICWQLSYFTIFLRQL